MQLRVGRSEDVLHVRFFQLSKVLNLNRPIQVKLTECQWQPVVTIAQMTPSDGSRSG